MERLEQVLYMPRQVLETKSEQKVYRTSDLEQLSAIVLYSEKSDYDKHIEETIRYDDHKPLGPHINYEVWLKLKGSKEGRNGILSNTHIPLKSGS